MNTKINLAGVELKNPVMVASGTFGSGIEYSEFVDLNKLGAVVTKGVANVPWPGNPTPRIAETYGGMINAIGLQNPGIDVFCKRDIPFLQQYDTKIIVNVCGKSESDYIEVVERLADEPVDMLEINISCPNVKEGGIAFGQNADNIEHITKAIKKVAKQPVIMKLSPNVTDITEMARAAEAGGADVLSLINTITGMKIDINRQTFAVANKTGGLSGPAVKPVAVRMVAAPRVPPLTVSSPTSPLKDATVPPVIVVMESAPAERAVSIRPILPPLTLIAPRAGAVTEEEEACAQIALLTPAIVPPSTLRVAIPLPPPLPPSYSIRLRIAI